MAEALATRSMPGYQPQGTGRHAEFMGWRPSDSHNRTKQWGVFAADLHLKTLQTSAAQPLSMLGQRRAGRDTRFRWRRRTLSGHSGNLSGISKKRNSG